MDSELLGSLIDRLAAPLGLYARQWCDEPEDVVQEAFVKLAEQATTPLNPAAWLFRTVRNGAINAGIARRRRRRHEAEAAGEMPSWFDTRPAVVKPWCLDPESAQAALAVLPLEQREIIVAHLWGGLTFDQIAELVGTSSSSAHRLYHAGLTALRDDWGCHVTRNRLARSRAERDRELVGSLVPARSRIDRDLVMFRAGQASARAVAMAPDPGSRSPRASRSSRSARPFCWPTGLLLRSSNAWSWFASRRSSGPDRAFTGPRGRAGGFPAATHSEPLSPSGTRPTNGSPFRCCATGSMACPLRDGRDGSEPRPAASRQCCKKNSADSSILETPHETNASLARSRHAWWPSAASAQPPPEPPPTVIIVRPAAEPVPALKYRLVPERITLVPGNAAIFYHRAIQLELERAAGSRQGKGRRSDRTMGKMSDRRDPPR